MYFVKYNPLKQKLGSRSLGDREVLPYLIVEGVVLALLTHDMSTEGLHAFTVVSMVLNTAIVIGGTFHVYAQNGGKEGFDLVRKYVVLGWVVGFRVFLVCVPVLATIAYLLGVSNLDDTLKHMLLLICGVAVSIIYYQRLGRHIRDTTAIESDSGEQQILP